MRKTLKIGNLELKNRVLIGPMAGVSNPGFRAVIKEFDPALIYSEMISDKAIHFKNKKTLQMCQVNQQERPLALQLFGYDIDTMVEGAVYFDKQTDCDVIDINMGCPVSKVVKNNGGSALMKEPQHAAQIVEAIKQNIEKPLTVKMRAGWDLEHINVVEMSQMIAQAGADAIIIHPRTRTQFYSGHSDWDLIRQVKEKVDIPVIGNGDIRKVKDMIEMENLTHCDGFMVSRGCLGNPWLISQMIAYDESGEILEDPTPKQRIDQCLKHAYSLIELKGETNAVKEMRSHACWYIDGLPKANKAKAMINFMETKDRMEEILYKYLEALEKEDFTFFETEE